MLLVASFNRSIPPPLKSPLVCAVQPGISQKGLKMSALTTGVLWGALHTPKETGMMRKLLTCLSCVRKVGGAGLPERAIVERGEVL